MLTLPDGVGSHGCSVSSQPLPFSLANPVLQEEPAQSQDYTLFLSRQNPGILAGFVFEKNCK